MIDDTRPKTFIEGVPADDTYSSLYDLEPGADLLGVAVYLLEVVMGYTEACRRMAVMEPHGFELLTGVYNTSAETVFAIAAQLSRDPYDQDEAGGPDSQD